MLVEHSRVTVTLELLYKSSAVAEMGDRLAAIDIGQKSAVPLSVGELGPHLTQCRLG